MGTEMIGKTIATLRKERGIKQEELASFVHVSAQAVSKWENGGVPDVELLPKIAEFFGVSVDFLFGRSITDYTDLKTALTKKLIEAPRNMKIKEALELCWIIEKSIMPYADEKDTGRLDEYENGLKGNEQIYSSMLNNEGFTRMGIANRLQYFLLVQDPKDFDAAYFDGINYTQFFKDLSDKDVFDACVMLNKRDYKKAFTANLLVKNLSIKKEKAEEVLKILTKYRFIRSMQIEMDDETQTVYNFVPTPSFPALLIFAREIIEKPDRFAYYCENRGKPYFE